MSLTFTQKCTEPNCSEWGHWNCDSRKDYIRISKDKAVWKCSRHKKPDEVLEAKSHIKTTERALTVLIGGKYDFKHFDNNSSGFIHGLKWKAWIDDFPVGTKIIEKTTVEVILPKDQNDEVS